MERLSLLMISIIICSIAVLGLGVFYSGISTTYNVADNQNISQYNQMTSINTITSGLNQSINNKPVSTGGFNIMGDFLSYAYNTIVLTFKSYDLFYSMMAYGVSSIPTGDDGNGGATINFMAAGIGSIVFILIIFSIIRLLSNNSGGSL